MGADSCGLQSPSSRVPPAQGRPDGPDSVPARPVGVAVPLLAGAGSPTLDPRATQPSAPGGFTDPPELPREGRCPRGPSPRSPGQDRSDTGRPKRAPSGREGRGVCWGETRGPDGSGSKPPTLPPFSSFHVLWAATGHWGHPGKIPSRTLNRGATLALKINKRLKSQLRGS